MKLYISEILKQAEEPNIPLGLSGRELSTLAQNPQVQQYVNEIQNRKNTKKQALGWGLPTAAASFGAAGYGMKRLGDAALTPDDRTALDNFMGMSQKVKSELEPVTEQTLMHPLQLLSRGVNPNSVKEVYTKSPYTNSSDLFWDYIDKGSRAINSKLYGESGLPVVHKVKHLLGLPEDKISPTAPAIDVEGVRHYPSFQEGPFSAYVHQIGKQFTDEPIYTQKDVFFQHPNKVDPSTFTKLTPTQRDAIATAYRNPVESLATLDSTPGGKFREEWLRHINEYLKQNHYGPVEMTPTGLHVPEAVQSLNHSQQLDLARDFAPSFSTADPEFYKEHTALVRNLADWQKRPIVNYGNALRVGTTILQDIPRMAGKGLMATGGALGLYWLLKKLRYAQHQKNRPSQVLNQPVK